MDNDLPPIPRIRFDDILLQTDTAFTLLRQRIDCPITPEMAIHVGGLLAELLGFQDNHTCTQTMLQYVGQPLTRQLAETLAAQIGGRESDLANGPLIAYDRPVRDEWVAMEVRTTREALWRERFAGVEFGLRCFTGHPAGHLIRRKFPEGFLSYLAYQVGWSRRLQFDGDARHFIGLRLWGFLRPVPDSDEVQFDQWGLTPSFRKHNLQLIRLRTRYDVEDPKAECPNGLTNHCFDCAVTRTECQASLVFPTSPTHLIRS